MTQFPREMGRLILLLLARMCVASPLFELPFLMARSVCKTWHALMPMDLVRRSGGGHSLCELVLGRE